MNYIHLVKCEMKTFLVKVLNNSFLRYVLKLAHPPFEQLCRNYFYC